MDEGPSRPQSERPGVLDRPQPWSLLSLVSAFATYLILTGLTPDRAAQRGRAHRSVHQRRAHHRHDRAAGLADHGAGARLARDARPARGCTSASSRLFSIIAALPTLLLAVGATITFSRSLDGWFATSTRAIVASSRDVANAYLDEHGQVIRTDIVNMARDLDMAAASIAGDPTRLQRLVMVQAGLRDLPVRLHHRRRRRAGDRDERRQPTAVHRAADERAGAGRHRPGRAAGAELATFRVGAVAKLEGYPGQVPLRDAQASAPRSSSICSSRRRTSMSSTACARRAAASRSRTASCT